MNKIKRNKIPLKIKIEEHRKLMDAIAEINKESEPYNLYFEVLATFIQEIKKGISIDEAVVIALHEWDL